VTAPSRLVLGSAQWGQPYGIANRQGPPDEPELERMLETATAAGIETIDTARAYGPSEALVGRLTAGDGRWKIVTKLADDVAPPAGSARDALEAAQHSLEASRQALRRDHLDVVLLHQANHRVVHDGALWRLLIEERHEGRIGAIGVSANSPEEAYAVLGDTHADAVQVATSLLDQRLVRSGFFGQAEQRGIRVFVRSVFLQGVAHLSPEALPAHLRALGPIIRSIGEWARVREQAANAPYLQFVRTLPAAVLIGVERNEQLTADLDAWGSPVPIDALRSLADGIPDLPSELLTPSMWQQPG
jgi:aryl-alcohol dehydrogenase-like predicted oxidoreductase